MAHECCSGSSKGRGAPEGVVAAAFAVLAALVPKCPFCLVGYAAFFGLSTGAVTTAHPYLRPLLVALAGVSATLLVARILRARRLRSG